MSGTIVWGIIFVIFLMPIEIKTKNILTFYCTGVMFPLAILMSKIIKAEWKLNENPLGMLGLYLNLAQFMYFPILFYCFTKSPEQMIIFFAVITGAHIFPYGWFYNTKSFMIMAPVMSILVAIIGYVSTVDNNWTIPLVLMILLVILDIWLYSDYNKKFRSVTEANLNI